MLSKYLRGVAFAGILFGSVQSQFTLGDDDSYKKASSTAAKNMMTYYNGDDPGGIPGLLPPPYYWWETGAMMGQLVHHWHITGNDQWNKQVKEALLFQIGEKENYMPANRSKDLGNDDQVFWALSAMDAAECKFSDPGDDYPSWIALAQAVFNTQTPRWETTKCNGGLRWQIYPFNAGFDYKNTVSNAGFFQLAARLARYTGNETYAEWADKVYDWMASTSLIDKDWNVWDGAYMDNNCSKATKTYWSYNVGMSVMGAAYMYDYRDQSQEWADRINGLVNNGSSIFFRESMGATSGGKQPAEGQIMAEVACEFPEPQTCNYDQPSFKAYLSRWLAVTTQLAPFTKDKIMPLLKASAEGAAKTCTGNGGSFCGRRWYQTSFDGHYGVGEQMSAMSVIQNNLIGNAEMPVTLDKGGTSKGDPSAGTDTDDNEVDAPDIVTRPITTGDKAGAAILTILGIGSTTGLFAWMMLV